MFLGMGHLPPLQATRFTTLIVKKISSLYLVSIDPLLVLRPLPLVLLQQALLKSLSPIFLISPLQVLKGCKFSMVVSNRD